MLRSLACLITVAALSGCATMEPSVSMVVGSRVLAEWEDTGQWWAGSVTGVRDGMISVAFDDGTSADREATQVRPLDWAPGSRVSCDGFSGEIVGYLPAVRTLTLRTSDNSKFETSTGACIDQRDIPAA